MLKQKINANLTEVFIFTFVYLVLVNLVTYLRLHQYLYLLTSKQSVQQSEILIIDKRIFVLVIWIFEAKTTDFPENFRS